MVTWLKIMGGLALLILVAFVSFVAGALVGENDAHKFQYKEQREALLTVIEGD